MIQDALEVMAPKDVSKIKEDSAIAEIFNDFGINVDGSLQTAGEEINVFVVGIQMRKTVRDLDMMQIVIHPLINPAHQALVSLREFTS